MLINKSFSVLWGFKCMPEDEIESKSIYLVLKYDKNLQGDSLGEFQSLKKIYTPRFGRKQPKPSELPNHFC